MQQTITDKYYIRAESMGIKIPGALKPSSPSKISLSQDCSFSLAPGKHYSCPGETKSCNGCYASKRRFLFTPSMRLSVGNFMLLKNSTEDEMVELINNIIPKNVKIFRIHDQGDFFSQQYINAWTKVIRNHPDIYFWAYTRSFKFNYQNILRLKNFNFYLSVDEHNKNKAANFSKRYKNSPVKLAYGPWEHGTQIPKNSFVCPATNKKIQIEGACEKCMLCVKRDKTNKNVVFLKH